MLKQFNDIVTGELNPRKFMNNEAFKRVSKMELFTTFDLEASLGSIAIDSTGNYLLGGEDEGRLVIYDLTRMNKSKSCPAEITMLKAYPNKSYPGPAVVQWFPSNPGLISTLSRGILLLYDANSDIDEPIDVIETTADSKYGSAFRLHAHHPWNSAIIVGQSDKEIRMFDLKVGAFVQTLSLPRNAEMFSHFAISRRVPTTLAASALSVSSCGDSFIFEYDARNCSQVVRTYVSQAPVSTKPSNRNRDWKFAHTRSISYMTYSDDGQYLYSHSIDGIIRKWSTDIGKCVKESQVPSKLLYSANLPGMDFTETSPAVAIVPRCNEIFLIDTENNKLLQTLKGHVSQIRDVAYDDVYHRVYSVAKEHLLLSWESQGTASHDFNALRGNSVKNVINTNSLFDTDCE